MTITELPPRIGRAVPRLTRPMRLPDGAAPLPPARGGGLARGFTAMRHANYRRYWFGLSGSLVGAWMQSVALPWQVLQLGGSPLQLGMVMAFMFGPSMFLAPLGGVLADRVDKRRMLMAVNLVALLQASTLFGLAVTGVIDIWHVYLLALVAGFVNAIEMPVRQAFVADLVPREDLVNAIALSSTSFNLSRVVGPAVAGVTIAAFGVASNFGINAISYLSVITGLMLIDSRLLHRASRPDQFPSVRSSLAEGLRFTRATPTVLWPLVLLGGVAALAMNFQTLLPLFTRDVLGMGSSGYGALFATMGAGALVGSLGLAFASSQRPLIGLIIGGGAGFLGLAFALGFPAACLPARCRHRSVLDAHGQHHQRDHSEQRPRRAPRSGHGPVRDGLRRQRAAGRPVRGRHGGGPRRAVRPQPRSRSGDVRPGAGGVADAVGGHAATRYESRPGTRRGGQPEGGMTPADRVVSMSNFPET